MGMLNKPAVIAVDGPSGAGKGTFATKLADYLDLPYLDTGLLYRRIAYLAVQENRSEDQNITDLVKRISEVQVEEKLLRTPVIDRVASKVATIPEVRQGLLEYQRKFARNSKGAILDGRDIGTEIVPDASAKFYITASPLMRAKRRFLQREKRVPNPAEAASMAVHINERDLRDKQRSTAPLRKADDAFEIVTDSIDVEQVFALGISHLKSLGLIDRK